MSYHIRKVRADEESDVSRICFSTLDNSSDNRYSELAGLRWAVPYVRYERENCFVAVGDDDIPVGYILSALDAATFRKSFRKRMHGDMSKALRTQRPAFSFWSYIQLYLEHSFYFEILPFRMEHEYPAHLHIDIHPEHQRKGLGFLMMDTLIEHLRQTGCTGVHLGVGKENEKGIRFYEKYGFTLLKRSKVEGSFYGLKLDL